jgi:TRAP-type uncharacterized transport system substrate-binding protein
MDIVGLIIQLVAGAVGGNAAGAALKNKSLGTAGNSIAGAIGGVILAQIVQRVTGVQMSPDAAAGAAEAVSNFDIGSLITQVVGGGAGGAILTAIVGMIKNR